MIDEKIRVWIIAMFKALDLGEPVFETGETDAEAETEADGEESVAMDLTQPREDLSARLDRITLPDRLPDDEAALVQQQIDSIRKVLDVAKTTEGLEKVVAATAKLEQNATALEGLLKVRLDEAAALLETVAKLEAPDMTYLSASEAPDFGAEVEAIETRLNGKIGAKTVETATAMTRDLSKRLDDAKTLGKSRADRVDAVKSAFTLITRPGGGVDEDYTAYDGELPAIQALEGSAIGETEIAAAETALSRLKNEAQRLATELAARAKRVGELKLQAKAVDFTGIDEVSGLTALQTELTECLAALDQALGAPALGDLERRITALETSAAEALAIRAASILTAAKSLSVSDELPGDEASPLSDRIEAVRAASTPPVTGAKLAAAAEDLTELAGALDAAVALIEDRKTRIAKAVDDVAKLTDPDDANKDEKAALDTLRKADALTPTAPFTEAMANAATSAAGAMAEKHAELVIAIKAREEARAAALKTLLSLVPPMSASGAETLKILKEGAALRARIAKADTIDLIKAEETAIAALKKSVDDITAIAKARTDAAAELAKAETLVKSERGNLFAGGYTQLCKMLSDAGAQIDAGKTVNDFKGAETEIKTIAPYLNAIKSYRSDLNAARIEAEFHINMMKTKSDKTDANQRKTEEADLAAQKQAMQAMWHALAKSADALAAQGKIDEAKKELAKFKTQEADYTDPDDASVTKKAKYTAITDPDAKDFPGVVKTFMTDKYPIIDRAANNKDVVNVNALKSSWGGSRSKGFSQQKWAEAKGEIATLSGKLDECKAFLDAYEPYAVLLKNAPASSDLANRFDVIKAAATAGDFVLAEQKVKELDALGGGDEKKNAAYMSRRRDLKARIEAVLTAFPGSMSDVLSTPWNDAETETDHDQRMILLDEAEAALAPLQALVAARDAATLKLGTLDGGTYKILDAAAALAGGTDVAKATAAYQNAIAETEKLIHYLALKARLTAVRDSYPATAAGAIQTADDALVAAEALATSQELDKASDALSAVLDTPEVVVIDKAIALFKEKFAKVRALHDKVLGAMTHQASKDKLTTPWAVIETTGNTDRKYLEATELLDAHVAILEEARPYVNARLRATKALSGLDKIAQKVPTATKNQIYAAPVDKAKLDGDLAAAEALAAAGKFSEATKAFDDLVALAKARMDLAAQAIEQLDHGHFLAGHGPDVPREETLARMTTGIRPDKEYAPSRKSSQFEDMGDFLACYEMAWEEAKAQKPFFGKDFIEASDPTQVMFTMDAGKAIGMGVEGITPQQGFDKGVEGPTDLFDTYEITEGLDKLQVKFMFHFTPPQAGSTEVITTFKRYLAAYKAENGGASPPASYQYPGRWAVNQLLPTTG